jgi:dGTPase
MPDSLAPFATIAATSRGRYHAEPESDSRTVFARDRDRVLHSAAFRRLTYKTQVFVYHEGDHYRTRLTHSLEVSQVARAIARALNVDEDLAEALALAHDLGHTPFGHAGERELNQLMKPFGGFDHNAQTLRVVTKLENRYAEFDGLNLTWETLEGLVKHNGPLIDSEGNAIGAYAEIGLPAAIIEYAEVHDLLLSTFASAEAQIAAIADDIAYHAHDIDDGLRAGLFDIIDLGDVPLVGTALADVLRKYPRLDRPRTIHETIRRMISAMILDVVNQTSSNVTRHNIGSVNDVRLRGSQIVDFTPQMK